MQQTTVILDRSRQGRHPAGFTLSLDCEGLWGLVDHPRSASSGMINAQSLDQAYDFLLTTLEASGVKATAAFVTCFAANRDELGDRREQLRRLATMSPTWLEPILRVLESGQTEGWDGSRYFDQTRRAGHEIAWHGTTHHSLGDSVPESLVEEELALAAGLFRQLGIRPRTVIFPRHQIGHLDTLRRSGFDTYRKAPPKSLWGRFTGVAAEFHPAPSCPRDFPTRQSDWFESPAGRFLNWPRGLRALIPVGVTIRGWKSMLRHAVDTGGYLHMWFHPHNLITAPEMVDVFRRVMEFVGDFIRSRDMVPLTIAEANAYYGLEV